MRLAFIIIFLSLVHLGIAQEAYPDTLTLRVNFILLQKEDGSGNFDTSNAEHMQYFEDVMYVVNDLFSLNRRIGKIDTACYADQQFKDSGIRFRLNKIISYQNDSLWNNEHDKNASKCPSRKNWYLLGLQNHLDSIIPPEEQGINVYFSTTECNYNDQILGLDSCSIPQFNAACSMFPSEREEDFSVIHSPNVYLKYEFMKDYPYEWGVTTFGKGLAHELGHSLYLFHYGKCQNLMNTASAKERFNLEDHQIKRARNAALNLNIKKYLDKRPMN